MRNSLRLLLVPILLTLGLANCGQKQEAAKKEPLIANKQFYVGAELPAKLVADPKLMDRLMDHYLAMCPFNAWLTAAMR